MKTKVIFIVVALIGMAWACQDADVNGPRGSKATPEQIIVKEVKNLPGKSIIYYDLPNDDNLKYVKARYSPRPGKYSEQSASYFTDSLVVEGFHDAGEYEVQLYSISTGGTESNPVIVKVSPVTPSYLLVSESAHAAPIFGGFKFVADNPICDKVFITIEKENLLGEWEVISQNYVGDQKIEITKRGLEAETMNFRYTIEDLWGNVAETKEFSLTPWLEMELPKRQWKQVFGYGEFKYIHYNVCLFEKLFDGVTMEPFPECWQISRDLYNVQESPVVVTIDLGEEYQLSRMEEWPLIRLTGSYNSRVEKYYAGADIKDFEIYGSRILDTSNPLFDENGNLNTNWTLMFKGAVTRPSGFTTQSIENQLTEEETYNFNNGVPREFEFSTDLPPVRYFKIRILSNWGGVKEICMAEISLYGTKQ